MAGNPNAIKIANLARALKEAQGEPSVRRYKGSHMRKVMLKFLNMTPADILSYECKNGFDLVVKNMIGAGSKGKDGAINIQVYREVKDTIDGRKGATTAAAKEAADKARKDNSRIIVDMPQPADADSLADPDLNDN